MNTFGRLGDVAQRPQKIGGKRINRSSKNWFLRPDHSLVNMFSAQRDRDRSENTDHVPGLLSASIPSESSLNDRSWKSRNKTRIPHSSRT